MSPASRRPIGIVDRLAHLAEDFRASNRFFKWRTAVVGGWILLAALSVGLSLSGGEKNPIGAVVQVRQILGGNVVHVQNNSSLPWQEMTITLPGGWSYERRTVRPQESVMATVSDFTRGQEENIENAADFSPSTITVSTKSGVYVYEASRR